MTQHSEGLSKLMALHLQAIGKVTLGRELATVLLHLADRRNDVFEVGLHDLRFERGQNKISCSAGATAMRMGRSPTNSTNLYFFSNG
jgi:hypothetical protein